LGVVYGLWIGFGILSLGTLLGEWGNFYAFKFFLKKHAARYERKSLNYACMAYIVREGGFIIVLLARLSAIPGHFTTAVFATVGMGFFIFTLATLLSMPKQLLVVYLGVAIEQAGSGTESTRSKVIKYVVLIVSTLITIFVAIFLYGKMQQARPVVQAQLREKRYTMLSEAATTSSEGGMLDANDSVIKLYDEQGAIGGVVGGGAAGYSGDYLEDNGVEGAGQQKKSRWKWGKRDKTQPLPGSRVALASMESLEKSHAGLSGVNQDGFRVSYEVESLAHSNGYTGSQAYHPQSRSGQQQPSYEQHPQYHHPQHSNQPQQQQEQQQFPYHPQQQQQYQPSDTFYYPHAAPSRQGQQVLSDSYTSRPVEMTRSALGLSDHEQQRDNHNSQNNADSYNIQHDYSNHPSMQTPTYSRGT
jgi:hypothetical protein